MNDSENLNNVDFSTVLAAAIHDMKNSLSLMMTSIEQMAQTFASMEPEQVNKIHALHYEASRLNTSMVHLLALYRTRHNLLPINCDEHSIEDIWQDIEATNQPYFEMRSMHISHQIDPLLSGYLDYDLVYVLLNDIVINAMRYSRQRIHVSATHKEQGIEITVEDDGPGYPAAMLNTATCSLDNFDIRSGRTGLGIYFARIIAMSHVRREKHGHIELHNDSQLGGSRFSLWLP